MIIKLSQGEKNICDTLLAIVGAAFGVGGSGLAIVIAHAPSWIAPFGGVAGLAVGYFVSDAITYVDTGQKPAAVSQATNLYEQAKPAILASIKNLPVEQQGIAQGILDTIDLEISKL